MDMYKQVFVDFSVLKGFFKHPFVKNNLFFTIASYLFRIFHNLFIFSVLARIFSDTQFGVISLIIMIARITQTVTDFGHRLQIVKEISLNNQPIKQAYVAQKINFKFTLLLLVSVPVFIYSYYNDFWHYSPLVMIFVLLMGYLNGIAGLHFAIFQGKEWFRYETYSLSILTIATIFALIFTWYTKSVFLFFFLFFIAHIGSVLFGAKVLEDKFGIPFRTTLIPQLKLVDFSKELKIVWTFGTIVIAEIFLTSLDSFFVEAYYSKVDLSYFEAIKKIVLGLAIVCAIFNVALMPPLTQWSNIPNRVNANKLLITHFMVIAIGVVTYLGYVAWNDTIIAILFGAKYSLIAMWDIHIGIFAISLYMRIIPAIYFVGTHREQYRLWLVIAFLLVGLFVYPIFIKGNQIRVAIEFTSYYNMLFSVVFNAIFFYYLYSDVKFGKLYSNSDLYINN